MRRELLLACCAVALTGLVAAETVYQSKDAEGKPVYTDQPSSGATPVELGPLNTTPAVAPQAAPPPQQQARPGGYAIVAIQVTNPIPNGLAPTTVGIVTEPALRRGDRWNLMLDGQVAASGTGSSATIPTISRGDHTLELHVVRGGGLVGSSGPKHIFVYWPSKSRSANH